MGRLAVVWITRTFLGREIRCKDRSYLSFESRKEYEYEGKLISGSKSNVAGGASFDHDHDHSSTMRMVFLSESLEQPWQLKMADCGHQLDCPLLGTMWALLEYEVFSKTRAVEPSLSSKSLFNNNHSVFQQWLALSPTSWAALFFLALKT
jgi:hypothetical protein